MTSRTNLLLFIVSGLFLAALVSRQSALALLALPFLFFLGAGLLSFSGDAMLQVTRSVSCERGRVGQSITVRVHVTNTGNAGVLLHVIDLAPSGINIEQGELQHRLELPANGSFEFDYSFTAARGSFHWQAVRIKVCDPFGLFERVLDLPAEGRVLILPEEYALRQLYFQPLYTLHTPGSNLSRLPGCGVDFWGVREYYPGDSMRWIDWRQSARHPRQLITKEFEREEIADIGLLLDARSTTNLQREKESMFEHSVQAAAALARYYLKAGNRVSLFVLGEQMLRVYPGSGKMQLVRIQDKLAACELTDTASLDTLKYLPVRLFPSHAVVIMISSLRMQDIDTVTRMQMNGYQVIILSPNPVQFAARENGSAAHLLAVRSANLERAVMLWRLRRMGVEVIDWPVNSPLAKTIQANRRVLRGGGV